MRLYIQEKDANHMKMQLMNRNHYKKCCFNETSIQILAKTMMQRTGMMIVITMETWKLVLSFSELTIYVLSSYGWFILKFDMYLLIKLSELNFV